MEDIPTMEQYRKPGRSRTWMGCGIGCLVVLILFGIGGWYSWAKVLKPTVDFAIALQVEMKEVQSTTADAAKNAAGDTLLPGDLRAQEAELRGQWVKVKGTVSKIDVSKQGSWTLALGKEVAVMGSQKGASRPDVAVGDEVVVVGLVSKAFHRLFTHFGSMAAKMAKDEGVPKELKKGVVFIIAKTVEPTKQPAEAKPTTKPKAKQ